MPIEKLMNPRSVAVVGASATPGKLGNTLLRNIIDSGFPGKIYPVNPRGGEILGAAVHTSVGDLPEPPDLAVIVTPAPVVPDIVSQCAERSVPSAVIISGGFAETGRDGEEIQADLRDRAARGGMSLLGPNCQGLNLPHIPLCATWPLISRPGKIAIVSQSGTVGAEMMDRLQEDGLGFSAFVSLGNRSDLDEADFICYLEGHRETSAIALYLEGIRDGSRFRRAVSKTSKPLIVLKAGRTDLGRQAITTHTRSLAGDHGVARGFFRQSRVLTAENLDQLYHFSRGAAHLPEVCGRRVIILTSSGGAGVLAVDRASELGLELPVPDEETAEVLRSFLPAQAIVGNPVDFTGDATAEHYRLSLSALRGKYDSFLVIFGDPIPGAAEALRGFNDLLVVCLGGGVELREEALKMATEGIPAFPTPEAALECQAALIGRQETGGIADAF